MFNTKLSKFVVHLEIASSLSFKITDCSVSVFRDVFSFQFLIALISSCLRDRAVA